MRLRSMVFNILVTVFFIGAVGSCNFNSSSQTSKSGATEVKTLYQVPKNSAGNTVEQQNILDRLKVTTDPTKVLWNHLIALDGKIVKRMAVKNKTTSSGKRLEARHWAGGNDYRSPPISGGHYTDEIIQPDGTYGESDAYIFWFDPMHRYHQWGTAGGLGYLLTDYPIDLKNQIDEITGLYRMEEAATKWQKEQESKLRVSEGKK